MGHAIDRCIRWSRKNSVAARGGGLDGGWWALIEVSGHSPELVRDYKQ